VAGGEVAGGCGCTDRPGDTWQQPIVGVHEHHVGVLLQLARSKPGCRGGVVAGCVTRAGTSCQGCVAGVEVEEGRGTCPLRTAGCAPGCTRGGEGGGVLKREWRQPGGWAVCPVFSRSSLQKVSCQEAHQQHVVRWCSSTP
jgi:hypothetical protein